MATITNFDANQVDPAVGFDPIPAGHYLAAITESEMKPTKSGDGRYLQLTFQILDGPFKGRLLWARLNLENANATTVKIARAELSAICRAVGVMAPKDSAELHNVPLTIKVGCKKRADTSEIDNIVKGYEKRGGTAAAASRPLSAAVAGSTPPWKRS